MISIDGVRWDVPCNVERTADMTASDISGLMLDRTYFNDVMGTYLTYDVTLAVPPSMRDRYDGLYETLTAPVGSHSVAMPYGNGMINLTAKIGSVKDRVVWVGTMRQYWRGVSFDVTALHPSKKMSKGEVVEYGRALLPAPIQVPEGTIYLMTAGGWVENPYDNADVKAY